MSERKPLSFWINSEGEFGHNWSDGTESIGGAVNLATLADEVGATSIDAIPQRELDRAFHRELCAEVVDEREFALHGMWQTLNRTFNTGRFRIYARFDYVQRGDNIGPALTLTTEYILPDDKHDSLLSVLTEHARRFGGTVTEMFSQPEGTQYSVDFNVYGKSVSAVGALIINWLTIMDRFEQYGVRVL